MAVVELHNVSKRFRNIEALRGVSLVVEPGQIFGYIGPNGAGKTTTIRIILGLLRPSSGTVNVFGKDPWIDSQDVRRKIGFLFEHPTAYDDLSVERNLELFARIYGIPCRQSRIREVLEQVDLLRVKDRKVGGLSKGMTQRLLIARLLLHRPSLLVLDEPTEGLDPQAQRDMLSLLRNLAQNGCSIFLSSHNLYQVEAICDRVALISKGEIKCQGSIESILREVSACKFRIVPSDISLVGAIERELRSMPGSLRVFKDRGSVQVLTRERTTQADICRRLSEQGIDVLVVEPVELSLSDVYDSMVAV